MSNVSVETKFSSELSEPVIICSGRIDSANASEFAEKLDECCEKYPDGGLILDFNRIEYISSAGLRVLLGLSKKNRSLEIIGTSPEVYDIFETTGFVELFSVSKKIKSVSVEGCEIISQGASGSVYRLDTDTIIKVFMPGEKLSVVQQERNTAQKAFLKGIPTAISYDVVKVGDSYGILYEMLKAQSLANILTEHPDRIEEYVNDYVDLLRLLHSTPGGAGSFTSMKDIYHEAIDYSAKYLDDKDVRKCKALIDSIPDRDTLVHGDLHPGNIMVTDAGMMLIDLSRMGMGHPVFDLLEMAASHKNLAESAPDVARMLIGPPEMLLRLWDLTLKNYFPDKSGEGLKKTEKQLLGFARLANVIAPFIGPTLSEEQIQGFLNEARVNLFPIIDDLIGSIDW